MTSMFTEGRERSQIKKKKTFCTCVLHLEPRAVQLGALSLSLSTQVDTRPLPLLFCILQAIKNEVVGRRLKKIILFFS